MVEENQIRKIPPGPPLKGGSKLSKYPVPPYEWGSKLSKYPLTSGGANCQSPPLRRGDLGGIKMCTPPIIKMLKLLQKVFLRGEKLHFIKEKSSVFF